MAKWRLYTEGLFTTTFKSKVEGKVQAAQSYCNDATFMHPGENTDQISQSSTNDVYRLSVGELKANTHFKSFGTWKFSLRPVKTKLIGMASF